MHRPISVATSGIALTLSIVLILLVLLSTSGSGGSGWMGGHMADDAQGLSDTGLIILVAASVLAVASAALLIMAIIYPAGTRKESAGQGAPGAPGAVGQTSDRLDPSEGVGQGHDAVVEGGRPASLVGEGPSSSAHADRAEEDRTLTVCRLLDGDERRLYEMLVAEGGEILQKNIVLKRVFSKAKVTRLLDKLEQRGLIRRERYGATNKIVLIR